MPGAGGPGAEAAATEGSPGGAAPSREASADAEHSGVSAAERETMYRMYSHHVEVGGNSAPAAVGVLACYHSDTHHNQGLNSCKAEWALPEVPP
jgi:hypothetical protein